MNLHYRSTNYNPQIASGVYSAAAPSAHMRAYPRAEGELLSSFMRTQCIHRPTPCGVCVLFKHVSVETIVYNVSEESNLLARRTRTLGSYPIERKKEKEENEREKERKEERVRVVEKTPRQSVRN